MWISLILLCRRTDSTGSRWKLNHDLRIFLRLFWHCYYDPCSSEDPWMEIILQSFFEELKLNLYAVPKLKKKNEINGWSWLPRSTLCVNLFFKKILIMIKAQPRGCWSHAWLLEMISLLEFLRGCFSRVSKRGKREKKKLETVWLVPNIPPSSPLVFLNTPGLESKIITNLTTWKQCVQQIMNISKAWVVHDFKKKCRLANHRVL